MVVAQQQQQYYMGMDLQKQATDDGNQQSEYTHLNELPSGSTAEWHERRGSFVMKSAFILLQQKININI